MRSPRLRAIAGGVVFLVAAWLCAREVADEWPRVRESVADANPGLLLLAVAAAGAGMTAIALGWRRCLVSLGAPALPRRDVVAMYYAGELGKYLPGSVWSVVGRAELVRQHGIARTVAYASVAVSLLALYGAALFPVGLVFLHPRVFGAATRVVERVARRKVDVPAPAFGEMARLVVSYLPAWLLIGLCTVAVDRALHAGGSPVRLVAATVLSWAAGFFAVPVPAGAGVREVVFIATAGLPGALAATVAVCCRLCFLLVDAAGAALGAARTRRPSRPPAEL